MCQPQVQVLLSWWTWSCEYESGKKQLLSYNYIHLFKFFLSLFHTTQYLFIFLFMLIVFLQSSQISCRVTFIEIQSNLNTDCAKNNLRKTNTKVADIHKMLEIDRNQFSFCLITPNTWRFYFHDLKIGVSIGKEI